MERPLKPGFITIDYDDRNLEQAGRDRGIGKPFTMGTEKEIGGINPMPPNPRSKPVNPLRNP